MNHFNHFNGSNEYFTCNISILLQNIGTVINHVSLKLKLAPNFVCFDVKHNRICSWSIVILI